MRCVWFDLAATVAEQAGDIKLAISYQEKAIATSGRLCTVFLHRMALREILCRSGRFQEALAFVRAS